MIHPLAFYRIFLKKDRIKPHGRHLAQNKTKLIWKLPFFLYLCKVNLNIESSKTDKIKIFKILGRNTGLWV